MIDGESLKMLAGVMAAGGAVIYPAWKAYDWLQGKFDKKADKEEVDRHRDYFVKVFEKLDEHARNDAEHFGELKDVIHRNQAEILRELGRKADR